MKYIYKDINGHTQQMELSLSDLDRKIICECGEVMWRVPQLVQVNWNGLPPHLEGTRPRPVQELIDTASERRAKYLDTERKK